MLRRILILLLACALPVLLVAPAEAKDRGSVYDKGRYNQPYSFEDEDCGFLFTVEGRAWGYSVIYNVKGSDGQAFLVDDRYHYREVLTNPDNGKKMYISGHGRFTEVKATHVEGDVWEFVAVDRGRPFVVRDGRGKLVLADHGKAVFRAVFDTLGDSQPGGEVLEEEVLRTRGSWPSLEPDFDFCAMVTELIG